MVFNSFVGQWVGTNVIDDDSDNDGAMDGGDFNPLIADSDGDGLLDGTELRIGTDPFCWDTDRDGLSDGDEVLETGTDPLDADTDDDGLTDGYVVPYHSPCEYVDFHTVRDGTVIVKSVRLEEFGWSTVYEFTHEINITYKGERANTISYEGYYALGEMSVGCIDPTVADSDNDGATDGLEAYIAEYLGNTTDFAMKDTDSDGLPEIVEIRAYLWAVENSNNAPEDTSLWLNPLIDDAYNDSDSDGLANIEEWERCYKFDYDGDEIPNFYDVDDDNDELPTSVELSVDLNPFNSADAHGDKDHDGLDNLWEYENGTMINDADTDHDGIDDGAELYYWNVTRGIPNETAVDYLKDPDVDRDNVTDGKEINGWTVKIIVGYDEQNNPISKDVTLYGDPLAAYRAPRKEDGELGDYIDCDEDNIPDIVESLLSNNSTFAKFARLFADPTSEYYDLWTSYNWTIAYFFSVRNNRNFHYYLDLLDANKYSAEQIANFIARWNNTAPHNKSCAENATQWLRDEFNPLITESMAPVITEFVVNTETNGWIVWQTIPNYTAHVVVEIRDVAGISRVRIRSICPDVFGTMRWTKVLEYSGEDTIVSVDTIIDITEVSATVFYNITVNGTDSLDNAAEWNKTIYGPAGLLIKTVADIIRGFWEFLRETGEKIVKALNFIWNYIISLLVSLFGSMEGDIEALELMLEQILSRDDLRSPLQLSSSIFGISSEIALVGTLAFVIALPFIAAQIISLDDFVYSAIFGLSGIETHNLFSYACSIFHNLNDQRSLSYGNSNYINYYGKTKSDDGESTKIGIYIAIEPSVGLEGVYISGGPGVEVVIYPEVAEVYTYLQTPTAEISPIAGVVDIGLAIDLPKIGYATYGPERASFSIRPMILGIGIPTNPNEHPYFEISFFLETNLFPAFQKSWLIGKIPLGQW